MSRDNLPAPEAVDGQAWTVNRSSREGATSAPRQAQMAVPDGNRPCPVCGEAHDRAYRLRELARTAIGPRSAKAGLQWRHKSSPETLEAVERFRLLEWAEQVSTVPRMFCPDEIGARIEAAKNDLRALALLAMQVPEADYADISVALSETPAGKWAAQLTQSARRDINRESTFEDVAKTAAWLEEYLESLEDEPDLTDPDSDEESDGGEDLVRDLLDRLQDEIRYQRTGFGERNAGRMDLERPALSIPVRPDRRVRGKRSAEEGDSLRDATRLLTDGRVFAGRRRKVGGSVLVDCSGSMGWSAEALVTIVSQAPAALVGAYSGNSGRGVLRIVARAGRRVPDDQVDVRYGGNEIDIPALKWLAEQREPRVWLSDGQVCGSNADTAWLLLQATTICRSARIRRVRYAEEIPAALAGRTGVMRGSEEL